VLLACITFPGGGIYPWVWIPSACAVFVLAAIVRPAIGVGTRTRMVDLALIASAGAIALQLIPIPQSILRAVDPHVVPLRSALWLSPPSPSLNLPITIAPRDTISALTIVGAATLLFWTSRQICEAGGAGRIIRGIAMIGLFASLAAIVQRSQSRELLYGMWRPLDAGARPYGPFVNRNHFATWVIMACPLVFGYLLARASTKRPQQLRQRLVAMLLQLGSMRVWLVSAACMMTLALLISTSRSGLIGLMGALAASVWLSRNRRESGVLRWMVFQGALLAVVAISFVNFDSLMVRLDETLAVSAAGRGRGAIWADALRLARDFAATGTGAGTFGTAITVYQTAEPGYSIGQAHNHFLQIAAEGGALVSVPAALAVSAFLLLFSSRLREDRTSNYLMRAGAGAGLTGVFVQSFWETGLRMPANAMLFAVAAAIATHSPLAPSGRYQTH
jgi:O-antigen ligase